MMSDTMTPQEIAETVAHSMFSKDQASLGLGMQIVNVGPGNATLEMTVRADMLNGFDTCHGGVIATLADTAFACACNSYNELTVASGFSVDLVAPSRVGDRLVAVAHEVSLTGRVGVYDITVTNQRNELVAVFRGKSYRIKGKPVVALPMQASDSVSAKE